MDHDLAFGQWWLPGYSGRRHWSSIDFETGSRVFADPNLMLRKDRVISGEQRWHGIGPARKAVLLVVHVYRHVLRVVMAQAR